MTPNQITQLRQLLKEAKEDVRSLTPAGICYPLYGEKRVEKTIDEALALLPCSTCNGHKWIKGEPCPDCQ